ncbi:epimerase [Candidatus Curtissbacteria bacterium RIFCSPLOWO2_02_FULL_40_13b]|uniref:Epimerase n=1 Tax=Candidatus Curtissbacteria bacterium RIFCSPLOWO2_02_FULL_40_13b TaxID=1797733 RepID=A0A1F5HXC8_9BACT|nr:MAG: epimerase [Candidatus Curtissbacteria bacterium RIFCSPLOWO2_02_FULL_40_13b]
MKKILVTGCAGFVGSNLTERLLGEGYEVIGIDNFNDYYNPAVKEKNIQSAMSYKKFRLYRMDILDLSRLGEIFAQERPEKVIHLAARAGVRASIADPLLYAEVNVLGTVNLLKIASNAGVGQFIYGSSSSVYGNSKRLPFSEDDPCGAIISPYGASKRAAEFFVETFHRNFGLKATILRLFTVYGPRGRPDMAPALFTKAILKGKEIGQFGNGLTSRDYTYIDDIVDGILRALDVAFDFEIINLGNSHPITLADFIKTLETATGKKAKIKMLPKQAGDVEVTWANIVKAKKLLGWEARTELPQGLAKYIEWLSQN